MKDKNNRMYFPKSIKDLALSPYYPQYNSNVEALLDLRKTYLKWASDVPNELEERMRYIRSVIVIDKEIKKLESK